MKLMKHLSLLLALAAMLSLTACAGKGPKYDEMLAADWSVDEAQIVDAEFVAKHVTIPRTDRAMLVDTRPYMAKHVKGYIPSSVSIPFTEMESRLGELPADKTTPIIFYCEGYF